MKAGMLIVFLGTLAGIFSISVATSQVLERRINRKPQGRNTPVTIVSVSNKRASLDLDTKFIDDEDWLKGLSFQIINSYHKGIRYVSLDLSFPRPKGETEPPFINNLAYGDDPEGTSKERTKLLHPGETVTLKLSDAEHESVRKILRNLHYPDTIVQVTIRLDHVVFEDGTLWKAGLFFRRDVNDPEKWVQQDTP
jgi:hypothetical protein